MIDGRFREAVTLYWEHTDGQVRPTLLQTTREAFKTITSGVRLPIGQVEYQVAFDRLVQAMLDPKPEKIEAARGALHRLANALAVPVYRRTVH